MNLINSGWIFPVSYEYPPSSFLYVRNDAWRAGYFMRWIEYIVCKPLDGNRQCGWNFMECENKREIKGQMMVESRTVSLT